MKLCKKLVLGLPHKNLVFDVRKGTIYTKRSNRLLVSIKDPFVHEMNYGRQMASKENLQKFVDVLRSFMKAASQKNVDEFFLQRQDPIPSESCDDSSYS